MVDLVGLGGRRMTSSLAAIESAAFGMEFSFQAQDHNALAISMRDFDQAHVRFGSILLKKASLISTNHDSVFLKLSATGDDHDGSPDGRSEPAVLPFQPRRTDSSGSSPTPAQSNRHAGAGRSSREAGAVLQRHRAALDRS